MHSLHGLQCSQESLHAGWAADLSFMGSLSKMRISALLVRKEGMPWATAETIVMSLCTTKFEQDFATTRTKIPVVRVSQDISVHPFHKVKH